MKIKEKKNPKLILTVFAIMIIAIIVIVILNTAKNFKKIKIASNEISTSNIGITTSEETNSWDTSKISEIIVDTSMVDSETGEAITMYVPIPAGYTASKATSEDTVIEGLVIYEGTDEVNDSNVTEAKTTRNQYVWIPVDPEDVYWTDDDGSIYGIEYTFSETGRTANKVTREPYISSSYSYSYSDYYLDNYKDENDSLLELQAKMQSEFKDMVESIEIYGGFYVGRYELGKDDSEKQVSMKGKSVYNSINWYNARNLCQELSNNNEIVQTNLIYGCLWDATLEFLVESGNKTYAELINSTGWGNYKDATFTYTNKSGNIATKSIDSGTLIPMGSTEYTNACNIYDLAGNIWEWTQEILSTSSDFRIYRGGLSADYGTSGTLSERKQSIYIRYEGANSGCRAVLWIS